MIKLYVTKRISTVPIVRLLALIEGSDVPTPPLFQHVDPLVYKDLCELVNSPEEADYLFVPHDYQYLEQNTDYHAYLESLYRTHSKQILLTLYGDVERKVKVRGARVLRTSVYRFEKTNEDIVIPPFVSDLGEYLVVRNKGTRPSIGFVGWARVHGGVRLVQYYGKVFLNEIRALLFGSWLRAKRQGIYFRQQALRVLEKSALVKLHAIIRNAYSANRKSIELDPVIARAEYINNIATTDFTLAVKGDGNYSLRFFEVLSMGRIPILIDTECVLPLEDEIDYASFSVRLPYTALSQLPQLLVDRYAALSNEEFRSMQQRARDAFTSALRADVFYRKLFVQLALNLHPHA